MLVRVSSCVASVTFVLIISSYYYAFVSILLFLGYLYTVFHKDIHISQGYPCMYYRGVDALPCLFLRGFGGPQSHSDSSITEIATLVCSWSPSLVISIISPSCSAFFLLNASNTFFKSSLFMSPIFYVLLMPVSYTHLRAHETRHD